MSKIVKESHDFSEDGRLADGKRWIDYDTIVCPDGQVIDVQQLLVDQQRAAAALSHLVPALGGFVTKLRPIYTFRVETQATDGYNIFINPQFTYNLDLTQKTFVLAHEIMHCLLNHLRRGKAAGHPIDKSNIAADYECNITLTDDLGLVSFDTVKKMKALIDKKYHTWGYEKIYADNPTGPSGGSMDNSGQAGKAGQQQGQQGNGAGNGQGQQSGGSRGGGNQGVVRPEDCNGQAVVQVPNTPGGYIDKATGDKLAESEGYDKEGGSEQQIAKDWKDGALKAAKQMKGKGGGPASFAARIESLYKPTKDWKKELKHIVGQSISPDDKRSAFAHKNTLVSQDRIARADKNKYDSMDYMVAMVDTSGSMSEDDIKGCLTELYAVALAKKPLKLVLMYFGSGVSDLKIFNTLNEFKKEMKHPRVAAGGGTEVGPCFRMLQEDPRFKRRMADLVMIFTDGYIDQVKRNPKITKNLCWVIIDNPGFDLLHKDIRTKCVHIKTDDMKR